MTAHSSSSSGPGLLMIASGMWILPMSCSSAPISVSLRTCSSTPSSSATLIEQVAQQQRGAAVGAAELERLGDAGVALAREACEERDQRQHEQGGRGRV